MQYATTAWKGYVLEENLPYYEMPQLKLNDTECYVIMGDMFLWKLFGPHL
jgi:hypothetical protein